LNLFLLTGSWRPGRRWCRERRREIGRAIPGFGTQQERLQSRPDRRLSLGTVCPGAGRFA